VDVLGDIAIVIIVYEGMTIDWIVEGERYHCEEEADDEIPPTGMREFADLFCGTQLLDLTTEDTKDTEGFCTSISVIKVTIVTAKCWSKDIQPRYKHLGLLINFNVVHLRDGIHRMVNGTLPAWVAPKSSVSSESSVVIAKASNAKQAS